MTTEYMDTANQQPNKQNKTEELAAKGSVHPPKRAAGRKKNFKVLHEDGSFADLPTKEAKGSGALDGMVGRGT
ncbi:MAG: hypothetical protein ACXVI9_12200 [Mucilaginibacter sp.]